MKLNMVVGSLVLSASLCTQSFGFDLLDRMLGLRGHGCDSACCDTGSACAVDPSCGIETPCGGACDPGCGVEAPCGTACDPGCGVESACNSCGPTCGVETACCGAKKKPLLSFLKSLKPKKACCDTGCEPTCGVATPGCASACEPTCGVDPCGCASACEPTCGVAAAGCDSCGCGKKPKLLGLIFGKLKKSSCCDTACDAVCSSCNSAPMMSAPAPVHSEVAPMPPAPVVDPSAYLQSKRRVIQASSYVR